MITLGRITGLVGTLGAVAMFGLLGLGYTGSPGLPNVIDVAGAGVAGSMFLCWGLALWHWGARYPTDRPGRGVWGAVVILGFVLGATAYWLAGAKPPREDTR